MTCNRITKSWAHLLSYLCASKHLQSQAEQAAANAPAASGGATTSTTQHATQQATQGATSTRHQLIELGSGLQAVQQYSLFRHLQYNNSSAVQLYSHQHQAAARQAWQWPAGSAAVQFVRTLAVHQFSSTVT
jgi:hypothetical protein